jgi:N-acetylmuramoyl-L-alanine amidase
MHNLKNTIFVLTLVLTAFLFFSAQSFALEMKNMRFGQHGNSVRAVIDIDGETDFRAMTQDSPLRIVIDTPALSGKPAIKQSALPALISDVRLEPLEGGYSSLTLILTGHAIIRSAFMIPADKNQSARLVIDMIPASEAQFAKFLGKPMGTLAIKTANDKLPFAGVGGTKLDLIGASKTTQNLKNLPLIVIDAGHGGRDSGATRHGIQEKHVTLAVAKIVKAALLAKGGYRVELTRTRDVFVTLPERVRIARRLGADLFVSVHADSAPEIVSAAQGASFYTISNTASDKIAASLAARENQVDMLAGVDLPSDAPDVKDILIDLTMRETTNQSRYFARQLIETFNKNNIPLIDAPHKQAGFFVLKAPDIPSVLIELGFVSNPAEAKKLNDETYRAALGQSIADGIDKWFKTKKH